MSQSIRQRRVLRQYVEVQRRATATRPASFAWLRSALEQLQHGLRARGQA